MRNPPPPRLPDLLLLFLLISFLSSPPVSSSSSTPGDSLKKGSHLSVEDELDLLTSPETTFSSGFYPVGSNAYCFSIWFTHSANKTIVWMANRDRPVNGQGSRISLNRDGNMVLTDVDGSTVWNTNTSNRGAERLELLDNGNLILKDPDGNILWQSFDFPTDTLLPSQPITKSKKIISARAKGVVSGGYYSFHFDNDNVLKLMYDGPEISSLYWPDPDYTVFQNGRTNYNSSRYGVLDEMGRFNASDDLKFNASDLGLGIKRRLTLDYDGNLRLYSLDESTGLWGISWAAIQVECKVHGLCGRNAICVYTPTPKCSCALGYEMSDTSDWNKGCKLKFTWSCDPEQVKFVALRQIDFYGFDSHYQSNISLESCRQLCLDDCSCKAFMYRNGGDGACFVKSSLFNGYRSPAFPGTTYLKLPISTDTMGSSMIEESDLICESSKSDMVMTMGSSDMYRKTHDMKYIYFYWFISAIGAIEVFFIASGWWYLFRSHGVPTSVEEGYQAISNQFRRFTYAELKKATNKFKEELGRGGSGYVYKGVLDDERVVAVKKLGDAILGGEEFLAEMSMIGKIYHMNLVRMWGYCSEHSHRLLVYEYVENGSLDKHLFSNSSSSSMLSTFLGWSDRFKIAVGTAKGLAYLHHECLEWVIHCDVKPENILLDSDFQPKIADFGLAKLSQRGGSGSNFSRIRGTRGYMAPEWALNLPITAMADVYSYGVVLLEIVNGNRLSNLVEGEEEEVELRRFVRMAKEKLSGEEPWIGGFVDVRLNGQFTWRQAEVMVEIGIACVEEDRNKRPTMDMVVQTLLACEDESPTTHHCADVAPNNGAGPTVYEQAKRERERNDHKLP